jgi:hypothetical protein
VSLVLRKFEFDRDRPAWMPGVSKGDRSFYFWPKA